VFSDVGRLLPLSSLKKDAPLAREDCFQPFTDTALKPNALIIVGNTRPYAIGYLPPQIFKPNYHIVTMMRVLPTTLLFSVRLVFLIAKICFSKAPKLFSLKLFMARPFSALQKRLMLEN
jgi:hypothetical protein